MRVHHVVREGVGASGLVDLFRRDFGELDRCLSWSTPAGALERLMESPGLRNTFGIDPTGKLAEGTP